MGFLFGSSDSGSGAPAVPAYQAATATTTAVADDTSAEVKDAADLTRKQKLLATGREDTVLNGGQGLTGTATTAGKTLLGQ